MPSSVSGVSSVSIIISSSSSVIGIVCGSSTLSWGKTSVGVKSALPIDNNDNNDVLLSMIMIMMISIYM